MAITISDTWLNQIKSILAYPKVDNNNTDGLFDDTTIKEYAVFPAMMEYFTKFPLKLREQKSMAGAQEAIYDFPDEYVFGVLDMRLTDVGIVTGTGTSFWDIVYWQQMNGGALSSGGQGAYGIQGYNPNNMINVKDLTRAAWKSYQNTYMTVKYDVDDENRKVHAYTTMTGYLNITWAKYSDSFDAIKFTRRTDVMKLSQAYLLERYVTNYDMYTDSSLDVTINTEKLSDKAKELRLEIKEKWDLFPDVIVLHSC